MLVAILAAAIALLVSFLVLRPLVRYLFADSVANATQLLYPKKPSPMDILMAALGDEVLPWRGGRVLLLCLLGSSCLFISFKAASAGLGLFLSLFGV